MSRREGRSVGPASTFALAPGVRIEPFDDGSALLYSESEQTSVSLNHTAALLCAYADGRHSVSQALREMQRIFPDSDVDVDAVAPCLEALVSAGFIRWK